MMWRVKSPLRLDAHDSKADVVVSPFGLEPEAEGRPAGPALVGPTPTPAHTRGRRCEMQIRVDTAGQFGMVPIPAPLEGVAVHVMQAPGIGGITANFGSPTERRSGFGSVVGRAFEVRLLAAEFVAERRGCLRACAAGVFPLRLSGQPKLPILRELAGLMAHFGEFPAESLRFSEVDIAHGEFVARGQLFRKRAWQFADH